MSGSTSSASADHPLCLHAHVMLMAVYCPGCGCSVESLVPAASRKRRRLELDSDDAADRETTSRLIDTLTAERDGALAEVARLTNLNSSLKQTANPPALPDYTTDISGTERVRKAPLTSPEFAQGWEIFKTQAYEWAKANGRLGEIEVPKEVTLLSVTDGEVERASEGLAEFINGLQTSSSSTTPSTHRPDPWSVHQTYLLGSTSIPLAAPLVTYGKTGKWSSAISTALVERLRILSNFTTSLHPPATSTNDTPSPLGMDKILVPSPLYQLGRPLTHPSTGKDAAGCIRAKATLKTALQDSLGGMTGGAGEIKVIVGFLQVGGMPLVWQICKQTKVVILYTCEQMSDESTQNLFRPMVALSLQHSGLGEDEAYQQASQWLYTTKRLITPNDQDYAPSFSFFLLHLAFLSPLCFHLGIGIEDCNLPAAYFEGDGGIRSLSEKGMKAVEVTMLNLLVDEVKRCDRALQAVRGPMA